MLIIAAVVTSRKILCVLDMGSRLNMYLPNSKCKDIVIHLHYEVSVT